jgi:hypothetical protein
VVWQEFCLLYAGEKVQMTDGQFLISIKKAIKKNMMLIHLRRCASALILSQLI